MTALPKSRAIRPTALALVLLVSVLLRVGAALYLGNGVVEFPGTYDQISYHALAQRVAAGHGFTFDRVWWPLTPAGSPTAHWSYLYTLYLAAIYWLIGPQALVARLVQAVIVGLLHPWLAWSLGRRLFGERAGLLAAALTALYAYFIYYSATLMTEPFYIVALLVALLLLTRLARPSAAEIRLATGLGLALGAAVLLRQLFLLVIPFLFLWLWWARRRRSGRWPIRATALAGGIVVLMILPFTLFNLARFDRFVLLNTNAGYAFFWGNHPFYGDTFIPILNDPQGVTYQELIPAELRGLDEAALESELLRRGLGFIVAEPGRYLKLSLSRIPPYFVFWPTAGSGLISNLSRVASFGLALPFMLFGLAYAVSRPSRGEWASSPIALVVLFSAVYTVIHVLTWTLVRYRLPVDAVLLLFAGLTLSLIWDRWPVRLAARQTATGRRHPAPDGRP